MPITFGTWFMTLVLWMGLLGCTAVPIKEGVYGPDMGDGKGAPVTGLKPSQFFMWGEQ